MKTESIPDGKTISTGPFINSSKIYVPGKIHDIQVAMREIRLADTVDKFNGKTEKNPSVAVYDTSGPFTDPNIFIDVKQGLPRIREKWILDRQDVEQLPGISSEYGKVRKSDAKLDELRFQHIKILYVQNKDKM